MRLLRTLIRRAVRWYTDVTDPHTGILSTAWDWRDVDRKIQPPAGLRERIEASIDRTRQP